MKCQKFGYTGSVMRTMYSDWCTAFCRHSNHIGSHISLRRENRHQHNLQRNNKNVFTLLIRNLGILGLSYAQSAQTGAQRFVITQASCEHALIITLPKSPDFDPRMAGLSNRTYLNTRETFFILSRVIGVTRISDRGGSESFNSTLFRERNIIILTAHRLTCASFFAACSRKATCKAYYS